MHVYSINLSEDMIIITLKKYNNRDFQEFLKRFICTE